MAESPYLQASARNHSTLINPSYRLARAFTSLLCTLLSHIDALENNFMRNARPSYAPLLSSVVASLRHS